MKNLMRLSAVLIISLVLAGCCCNNNEYTGCCSGYTTYSSYGCCGDSNW